MDLQKERLILPDRQVRLTSGVLSILQKLRKAAPPEAEWVLMSPRSRRPYERTRLSKLVRAALVQGGLDDLSLRDLRLDYDIRVGGENQVLDVVRRQGSITRNEVMALLRVSKNTAYNRLRQMVARGKLTKVGNRYYLPSTVVPPEDQEQAILAYLSEAGFAYRQDIARVANRPSPVLAHSPADAGGAPDRQGRAEIHPLAEGGVRPGSPGFPPLSFLEICNFLLHKLPRIRRF